MHLTVIRIPDTYMPRPDDGRIVRVSPAYQVRERDGFGHCWATFRDRQAADAYAQAVNNEPDDEDLNHAPL